MIVHYGASGAERKRLAEVVAKEIGVDARYLGAPSFSYQMDYFTVDREGALVFDDEFAGDESERVFNAIADAGFIPMEEDPVGRPNTKLAVQMPPLTGDELSRLESLIASKESLIKKAIGASSLMVKEIDGKLTFDWFKTGGTPEETTAYYQFVSALYSTAKKAKRINAKDKPVENEKYALLNRYRLYRIKVFIRNTNTTLVMLTRKTAGFTSRTIRTLGGTMP